MRVVENIVLSGTDDERFNRQLQLFKQNKLTSSYLSLGSLGSVLKKIGIYGNEIRLFCYVLQKKLSEHTELSIDLLKDLPSRINHPVFVFYYSPNVINVITESVTYNRESGVYGLLLVGLLKSDKYVYVYLITTLHGRPLNHLINWVNQDKLVYADINKANRLTTETAIASYMVNLIRLVKNKYETKIINDCIFLPENLKRSDDSELRGVPRVELLGTGDVFTTLRYIERIIVDYHWQTALVAPRLRGDTVLQTAYNIWTWCRRNFKYRNDTMGTEELRTPYRSWLDRDRGIDCDDFTILVSSILIQLGIRPQLIMVAFNGSAGYSHIFAGINCTVLGGKPFGGVIIDPVDSQFNRVLPGISKTYIRETSPPVSSSFSW